MLSQGGRELPGIHHGPQLFIYSIIPLQMSIFICQGITSGLRKHPHGRQSEDA